MLLFLILIFCCLFLRWGSQQHGCVSGITSAAERSNRHVNMRKKRREASLIECDTRLRVWLLKEGSSEAASVTHAAE